MPGKRRQREHGAGVSGELHTELACWGRPPPGDRHCLAPSWTNAPNFLPSLFWDIKKAPGSVGWCCASRHGPQGRRGAGRGRQIPPAPWGTELEGPAPLGARSRYMRNGHPGAPRQPSAIPPWCRCSRGLNRTPGPGTAPAPACDATAQTSPCRAAPARRLAGAVGVLLGAARLARGSLRNAGRASACSWQWARAKPDG